MEKEKTKRIFIALPISEKIKKELAEIIKIKNSEMPKEGGGAIKWTSRENYHITILFLGDKTEKEIEGIKSLLQVLAKNANKMNIVLSNLSLGISQKNPKIVWAKTEENKLLENLGAEVRDTLKERGLWQNDGKKFFPHITLGRIKTFLWKRIDPEEIPDFEEKINLNFTCDKINLMESRLTPRGPIYTNIKEYKLI